VALTSAIGAANGATIAWLRIHPTILTLASATILTGVMLLISGGAAVAVHSPVGIWLAQGHVYGVSISILAWLLTAAAVTLLLRGTTLGLWLYAIGANARASQLSGVPEKAALVTVYAISGGLAGLTGVLLSGVTMQGYIGIGDSCLLLSIAAVVGGGTSILGGHGGYGGTIAGSTLLTIVTSIITIVDVSAGWRSIMLGVLVLSLLALYAREGRRV
jgi:ribose transport system permease protein